MSEHPDNPRTARPRRFAAIALALVMAGSLAGGLAWLVALRYQSGDNYPEYSSFRADPKGMRALHDALARLDGGPDIERNLQSWKRFQPGRGDLVVIAGIDVFGLGWIHQNVEQWTKAGASVLITLKPDPWRRDVSQRSASSYIPPWVDPSSLVPEDAEEENKEAKDAEKKDEKDGDGEETLKEREMSDKEKELKLREMLDAMIAALGSGNFGGLQVRSTTADTAGQRVRGVGEWEGFDLPVWRGTHAMHLEEGVIQLGDLDAPEWVPLAVLDAANGRMTAARIAMNAGTVTILSDAGMLSNEALWREAPLDAIHNLAGFSRRVIFDEFHLGTERTTGIVELARSFHLHGLFAGAVLLFVLLVWQGAVPLVPIDPDEDLGQRGDGSVAGRDASDALSALLRRALPAAKILPAALERWRKSGASPKPRAEAVESAAAEAAAARPGALARSYQQITRILHERRTQS